ATNASDSLKSYDLAWLLHLVGDVHQPLHCATRVSKNETNGDNGGNKVTIGSSELHAVWDGLLGSGSDEKIILKLINVAKALPGADPSLAADSNEQDWVDESFHLARTEVYVSPIGSGDGPFTLTSEYKTNALRVAQERIALAGARLANLREANLK